jgi:hypothetical protein
MSIQPNELRIGNLIYIKCVAREVMDDEFEIQECNINNIKSIFEGNKDFLFKPIPLTEEWLLNFGFKVNRETKEGNNIWRYNWTEGHFEIEQIYSFFLNDNNGYDTEIKYVHQLQNLFFALTMEELNKK